MTGRDGAVDYATRLESRHQTSTADPDGHTYRVIELVGTSEKSIEEAINSALKRAQPLCQHDRKSSGRGGVRNCRCWWCGEGNAWRQVGSSQWAPTEGDGNG